MFEKTKRWWDKKKSISFVVYSFLFVVAFVGGSFFSIDETNASSLVPTIHSVSTSGNWSDSGSWAEGRVPTPTDVVAIRGTITLNAVPTISGLLVDWGGNIAGATTITVNGDIENHGVISGNSYITLNSGNLTNRGVWLVQMTTINGIASIVDSDTPIMGSILLNSDISIIGNLNLSGYIGFQHGVHNISLQDGHGIISKAGFYDGTAIISGTNTFMEAGGFVSSMTITGSLDRFIYNTSNNTQPATSLFMQTSNISANTVDILAGSGLHVHQNSTFTNIYTNTLRIASGASLELRRNLDVYGNVVNEGTITGAATLAVSGNMRNDGIVSASATLNIYGNAESNGTVTGTSTWNVYGNLIAPGVFTVANFSISGTGTKTVNINPNSVIGNVYLNTDISIIGDLNITSVMTLQGGSRNITLQDNHGITAFGFHNGTATISGFNSFMRTTGFTDTITITGSLDRYIIDTSNNTQPASILYFYKSNISANTVDILAGSGLHVHQNSTFTNIYTNTLRIASGASLELRRNLDVYGNVVNEGKLTGGATCTVQGSIENRATWTAPTYISWSAYPGASNYNLVFTPGTSTGITTTGLSYNITDKIAGQYYWQVTPNNASSYSQKCINMGCISGWWTPPVVETPLTTTPISQNDTQLAFCNGSSTSTQTAYSIFPSVYADNLPIGGMCKAETVPTVIAAVETNKTTTTQSTDALDPVDLATGDFTYNNTLLHIVGNSLDYELALQYRSRSVYDGPVGQNWDHNYNKKLVENSGGTVTYYDGKLGKYTFVPSGSGYTHMGGLNVDLVKSSSGTYTMFFNDGTRYTFGGNNKITSLTNQYHQSLNFSYNNSGALTTVIDTLGRTITYAYDTTDHLTSVTESGGKRVTFTYYGSGDVDGGLHDLKGITIQNGSETKTIGFTYYVNTGDANLDHNIKRLIDSKGQVYVENTYDTNDRVLSQKYGNNTGSYIYTLVDIHEDDTPTTIGTGKVIGTYVAKNRATNRNGKITDYTYDRMGNVTERATIMDDGSIVTTRYNYNGLGQLISEILPNGNGTKYAYDALGNKTMIRKKSDMTAADDDATDIVTILTYNGAKNTLSQVIDPRGKITNFTTDANGNITEIVEQDASGATLRTSHFTYDSRGHLLESTDARGGITKMTYTQAGQIATLTRGYDTPDATTTSYTYDAYRNPLTVTDGRGNTKTLTYDAYDRLTATLTPEGIRSEFVYDANNNKTRTTTTLDGGVQVTADTVYNLLDKPTTLTADIDANQRATLTYAYDANENLLTTTYPNGQVETRTYDALDRLIQKNIQGSTTHTTSYAYDQNGNVLTENKDGQTSTFTYDAYDRLSSSTDAGATKTTLTYDKGGNILEVNQRDTTNTLIGQTIRTYDAEGRLVSNTEKALSGGADRVTQYTYDADTNILTETDANNHTTTLTYDTLGRQKTILLPSGLLSIFTYDANSNIIKQEIKNGNKTLTTTATYDKDNRKTSTTDANGNTTNYTYNQLGQVTRVTDPKGIPTDYTYDYRGNVKTETGANKTITKSYDAMGNLTSLTDANSNTTTYTYNGNNERITEFLPDGNKTSYTYDQRGNIHTKTDPNGTITTYTYDSLSRITRKDYTLGVGVGGVTYETYAYDALGRLVSSSNSDNNQTSFIYDTLGNLKSETSGGKTTTYTYDALGNKTSMRTPNGRTLVYTYDHSSRLMSIHEGATTVASYTYDALSLMSEILANGVTTNYGYDTGNRLNLLQSPAQSDTLTYDANSNITSKGSESYTYDTYNQLTEVMYGNTRFGTGIQGQAYDYDLMGNRINEQNIRIITKTNKKTGTTTEIQRNKVWNYTTNSLNQYTDVLVQSGTVLISTGTSIIIGTETMNMSSTNTGISTTNTGTTSTGTILTDSGASIPGGTQGGSGSENGTGTTSSGTTTTDTGATSTGTTVVYIETGTTNTGTILIASEIISLTDTGTTNTGTTDSGASIPVGTQGGSGSEEGTNTGAIENPIVDTGSLQGRLLYDKNGNLIGNTLNNKRVFEYVYDAQNRLVTVSRYNTTNQKEVLISFSYDALGRRTSKRVANVVYEYIYSGNDVIEETQSNINPTTQAKTKKEMREYTYGARGTDDIVAVRYSTYTRVKKLDVVNTTGDYYYEKNHLGSVIRITSNTGGIVDEYSYTVFGKAYRKNLNGLYKPVAGANDSPIGNTRLYTGREYDKEISLYYMRARFYDAGMGRFISRDPIGMKDNINLYTYVANSPLVFVDRFGREKQLLADIQNGNKFTVTLVGRNLEIPIIGSRGTHTFIMIDSKDSKGITRTYTIGGQDKGNLVGIFNHRDDKIEWKGWMGYPAGSIKDVIQIDTPSGMTSGEFVQNIYNEYVDYNANHQVKFNLFSKPFWGNDSGNCSNLSTTLLYRASDFDEGVKKQVSAFNTFMADWGVGEPLIY